MWRTKKGRYMDLFRFITKWEISMPEDLLETYRSLEKRLEIVQLEIMMFNILLYMKDDHVEKKKKLDSFEHKIQMARSSFKEEDVLAVLTEKVKVERLTLMPEPEVTMEKDKEARTEEAKSTAGKGPPKLAKLCASSLARHTQAHLSLIHI